MQKHEFSRTDDHGFIRTVVLIVIALIILGVLGYNVRDIINSPTVKANLTYFWQGIVYVWDTFLKGPASFVWDIVWGIIKGLAAKSSR